MYKNTLGQGSLLLLGIVLGLGSVAPLGSAQIPNTRQQAKIQTALLEHRKEQEKLPEYLVILSQAGTLDSSAVGIAAIRSNTYKAFERALAAGNTIRPQIETLLQQSTPAGRIYAAILLEQLDRSAGDRALRQLQSDHTQVTYLNGCIGTNYKVSELATKILQGDRIVR
ncbi:hypothetical protein TUMEXPCC7403_15740 [Tumidithrix helvetica PCC 7403]|uniref:hypothetical protein n=1 Tax=Tumidithrix helvetica TaxID=3457545 RepID=UPI003C9B9BF1